jgi:AcrR family transcriptional regulator
MPPESSRAADPGDAALVYAPKQARSRRTLDRLLDAAAATLAELGVEGATVPAIAERAGMSVGVVYRRFRDKDALLRAVYGQFFESSLERNRAALASARWAGVPAVQIVATVVGGMVRGHDEYRGLLRALFAYAQTHPDAEFRRQTEALNAAAIAQVTSLLLERRTELSHPDPERAVGLALLVVASALYRRVQVDVEASRPYADAGELTTELTRMVVQYLGIDATRSGTAPEPPPARVDA